MIYSDNTFDITNNIATYTRRDFKSVFDTTSNKWYSLVNGEYIEDATQAAAPTIISLWGSKIFRNSNRMYKLYRNEDEQAIWDYKSDAILKRAKEPHFIENCLYFKALSDNATMQFTLGSSSSTTKSTGPTDFKIARNSNDEDDFYTPEKTTINFTLNEGEIIYMWGKQQAGTYFDNGNFSPMVHTSAGTWEIGGDLSSLYDFSTDYSRQRFCGIFNGCRGSIYADKLMLHPSTYSSGSYTNLFRQVNKLLSAPTLLEGTYDYRSFSFWVYGQNSNSFTFTTYATGITGGNTSFSSMFNDGVSTSAVQITNLGTLPNAAYNLTD